jgi:hypothetical protein
VRLSVKRRLAKAREIGFYRRPVRGACLRGDKNRE